MMADYIKKTSKPRANVVYKKQRSGSLFTIDQTITYAVCILLLKPVGGKHGKPVAT